MGSSKGQRPPSTAEELREATRAANEAIKDLKAERKALEELRSEVRRELEEARAGIKERVITWLEEATRESGQALAEDIQRARAQIYKRFDQITAALMGARDERPGLEELVGTYVAGLSPTEREKLAVAAKRIQDSDEAPASSALLRVALGS